MKYILLTVPNPNPSDSFINDAHAILTIDLEKLGLPHEAAVRLGPCGWLIPRDAAMPFVLRVADAAKNRNQAILPVVQYLRDDD